MALYLSKQYHSSPSLPQFEDESNSVTLAVSADELDGGAGAVAGGGGANETDKGTANSVYWSSGGDDMRYERSRIKSFGKGWPHDFLDPKKLARAGFYYLNTMDLVQCPFCGLKLDGWGPSHDPMKEHRRWQPRCPLILDIPCGNVVSGYHVGSGGDGGRVLQRGGPAADSATQWTPSADLSNKNQKRIFYETAYGRSPYPNGEWHKLDLQLKKNEKPSLPTKSPQIPAQQKALPASSSSQFSNRIDWTRPRARSIAVPKEREKEMFTMLNASDKYTSRRPVASNRDAFAYIWTPKPFSSKRATVLTSAVQSETYERPKSFGHVVRAPDILRVKIPASKMVTEPDSMKRNQFKYASVNARLESYASWPCATKQMPYVLAEAGFYYSGIGDATICFSCGGGLKNWVTGVDPWVEHARWYSSCSFLRMMKGDPYVTWVVRNKMPEVNAGNVRPYIVISNILGSDEKDSSSQPSVTQKEELAIEQFGRNFYYMGYRRRGKFLIFKNDHFGSNVFLPHNGAYSDLKNLTNIFAQLNFEVYLYENLKYEEIISVLMNVAQEDHSNADCFGMAVFTRGEGNEILTAYDRQYFASDLYRIFSGNACQSLSGKPKIFFFNVCESNERGLKSQSMIPNKIPLEPDFLLTCTSWNDYMSWNHPVVSSLQRLCEELRINGPKGDDLLSILRRIGYSDDKTSNQKNKFQSSLRKNLCFLPKVW